MSQADLGQFNFNIDDMDLNTDFPVQNDFSFYQQPFNGDFNVDQQIGHSFYQQQPHSQIGGQQTYSNFDQITDSYDTPGDSYDPNQLMPVPHSRPHPSGSNQNSGQIESSQMGWADFSMAQGVNDNGLLSSTSDWSILESTLISDFPGRTDQFLTGPSSIPRERVSSSRSPLSSRNINDFHSSPMSDSAFGTSRSSTTRIAPTYSITLKDAQGQHEHLDSRPTEGTSRQDILSVPTVSIAEDRSSVVANVGLFSRDSDLHMVHRTQTQSSAQYVDSSQETHLATQARSESNRSAILQATAATVQVSVPSLISASLPLLATLAVLGFMFLFSKVCLSFPVLPNIY